MRCIRVSACFAVAVLVVFLCTLPLRAQTPISIYGAWHCYTDGCSPASVPSMTLDRNMNGTYEPSADVQQTS